jgi:hypothetical protein
MKAETPFFPPADSGRFSGCHIVCTRHLSGNIHYFNGKKITHNSTENSSELFNFDYFLAYFLAVSTFIFIPTSRKFACSRDFSQDTTFHVCLAWLVDFFPSLRLFSEQMQCHLCCSYSSKLERRDSLQGSM